MINKNKLTIKDIARTLDHSLLSPELSIEQIIEGCKLAKKYNMASICVKPSEVALVAKELEGTDVLTTTVIGFPHGVHTTKTKVYETEQAIKDGAVEVDVVLNIGRLLSGDFDY